MLYITLFCFKEMTMKIVKENKQKELQLKIKKK